MAVALSGRTPSALLEAMERELKEIYKGVLIEGKDKDGEEVFNPIHVYIQGAPLEKAGEDPEETYPQVEFRIVQGYLGDTGEENGNMVIKGLFIYGLCDYEEDLNGWKQLLHMYELLNRRFREKPYIEGFKILSDNQFEMQANDTYPFQFMASTMFFMVDNIERTDTEDYV